MALTMLQVEARKHRAHERDRIGAVRGEEIKAQVEAMMAPIRAYAEGFKMGGWAHQCSVCGWKYTAEELDDLPVIQDDERWIRHLCPCGAKEYQAMATPKFKPFTGGV